jgi:hypothetical protein
VAYHPHSLASIIISHEQTTPQSPLFQSLSQGLFSISKIDAHQLDPILKLSLGTEKQRSGGTEQP